jgi:hypothetical protein
MASLSQTLARRPKLALGPDPRVLGGFEITTCKNKNLEVRGLSASGSKKSNEIASPINER